MRRALSMIAIAALAACGGGGGDSGGGMPIGAMLPPAAAPAPEPAPKPIDCSVALFGDSILFGGFFPSGRIAEPPAAGLKRMRPALQITDRSEPGDSAKARMPSFINEPIKSRVVVLSLGLNDAGQGYDYEPPLRAMVERVKAIGATPVVTGISLVKPGEVPARDAYDAIARRVAAESGAVFADWGAVHFDVADMADAVHPAQAYSTRLTEQLALAVDRAAPECKP